MNQQEADAFVQRLYDSIFDSLTKAEPGGKPIFSPATTIFSLAKPGMVINAADFRNPWTPGNLNGSQDAALHTADLVDDALKLASVYTQSGNSISSIYGEIMDNVQVPVQAPNPAIEKQLADAHAVLYRTINRTDSETGEVETVQAESQVYRDYQDNQSNYFTARAAYIAAYQAAQETASGRSTWPLVAPTLQIPVKQAYDKWRSNNAAQVEEALAVMNTSSQNALSKAFDKAKKIYEGYGVNLDETGTGMSKLVHRSYLLPSDWYSSNSVTQWIKKDVSSGSTATNTSSDYVSGGGQASFSLGIFSIGGGGGHSEQRRHMDTNTQNLRVKFEYTLVTIRRPWLNLALLATKGWNLTNLYPKGKLSNGTRTPLAQQNSLMPMIPTAFVVARKILISANWSQADSTFIQQQTSAGGGFGIGPFRIGGSYASSSSSNTFHSSFANGVIDVPGVQIIGWISQVVPECPPN